VILSLNPSRNPPLTSRHHRPLCRPHAPAPRPRASSFGSPRISHPPPHRRRNQRSLPPQNSRRYNCGQAGHMARDCPTVAAVAEGGSAATAGWRRPLLLQLRRDRPHRPRLPQVRCVRVRLTRSDRVTPPPAGLMAPPPSRSRLKKQPPLTVCRSTALVLPIRARVPAASFLLCVRGSCPPFLDFVRFVEELKLSYHGVCLVVVRR
jgi:hypothetical protein